MRDDAATLERLKADVRAFVGARDWTRFHRPKDLAVGLAIEAAELLEVFQWQDPDAGATRQDARQMRRVREELADVLHYTLNLANVLEIDLATALADKMRQNEAAYPVDAARGNARKQPGFAQE